MYVGLFWVSMLLASWLWVAAAAAFLGRIRPAWLRIASLILFFLVPSALLASLVLLAGFWKFSLRVEDNWFAYFTSLAAAYLIAGILIIYRASRYRQHSRPASARWRRTPRVLGLLAAIGAAYLVAFHLNRASLARTISRSDAVATEYAATAAAINGNGPNAAPIYSKVFAELAADPGTDIHNRPFGDSVTFDPKEPATLAYLNRHAAAIDEFAQRRPCGGVSSTTTYRYRISPYASQPG